MTDRDHYINYVKEDHREGAEFLWVDKREYHNYYLEYRYDRRLYPLYSVVNGSGDIKIKFRDLTDREARNLWEYWFNDQRN